MFPGGRKGTVRKRRRKLTYRKGNQDIEVGACDWRDPEA